MLLNKKHSFAPLSRLIDEEQPKFSPRGTFGWEKYYDLPDIYSWLDQLLEEYPDTLSNHNIGKSYENRTIRAIKLSSGKVSDCISYEVH